MIIHRLTVNGKDYFLPSPIDDLKAKILAAVKDGGGYVNIPPLRDGSGLDILFSPGMPVLWSQIEVGDDDHASPPTTTPSDHDLDTEEL